MKNIRKHKFKYTDPQTKKTSPAKEELDDKDQQIKMPRSAQIDLKRTAITIGAFTVIIILLYVLKDQLRLTEISNLFN